MKNMKSHIRHEDRTHVRKRQVSKITRTIDFEETLLVDLKLSGLSSLFLLNQLGRIIRIETRLSENYVV